MWYLLASVRLTKMVEAWLVTKASAIFVLPHLNGVCSNRDAQCEITCTLVCVFVGYRKSCIEMFMDGSEQISSSRARQARQATSIQQWAMYHCTLHVLFLLLKIFSDHRPENNITWLIIHASDLARTTMDLADDSCCYFYLDKRHDSAIANLRQSAGIGDHGFVHCPNLLWRAQKKIEK